jgi:penicillin-binding protein 1A
VPGLAGGRAPARTFADYMKIATAKRPVEQFDTGVTLPEWQLEPDEEAYGLTNDGMMVDENGLPIEGARPDDGDAAPRGNAQPDGSADTEAPQRIDQRWIDSVLGRNPKPEPTPARPRPTPTPTPARPAPAPAGN